MKKKKSYSERKFERELRLALRESMETYQKEKNDADNKNINNSKNEEKNKDSNRKPNKTSKKSENKREKKTIRKKDNLPPETSKEKNEDSNTNLNDRDTKNKENKVNESDQNNEDNNEIINNNQNNEDNNNNLIIINDDQNINNSNEDSDSASKNQTDPNETKSEQNPLFFEFEIDKPSTKISSTNLKTKLPKFQFSKKGADNKSETSSTTDSTSSSDVESRPINSLLNLIKPTLNDVPSFPLNSMPLMNSSNSNQNFNCDRLPSKDENLPNDETDTFLDSLDNPDYNDTEDDDEYLNESRNKKKSKKNVKKNKKQSKNNSTEDDSSEDESNRKNSSFNLELPKPLIKTFSNNSNLVVKPKVKPGEMTKMSYAFSCLDEYDELKREEEKKTKKSQVRNLTYNGIPFYSIKTDDKTDAANKFHPKPIKPTPENGFDPFQQIGDIDFGFESEFVPQYDKEIIINNSSNNLPHPSYQFGIAPYLQSNAALPIPVLRSAENDDKSADNDEPVENEVDFNFDSESSEDDLKMEPVDIANFSKNLSIKENESQVDFHSKKNNDDLELSEFKTIPFELLNSEDIYSLMMDSMKYDENLFLK